VNTLLMATSISRAKGHKPIAWRGSPNSYFTAGGLLLTVKGYDWYDNDW